MTVSYDIEFAAHAAIGVAGLKGKGAEDAKEMFLVRIATVLAEHPNSVGERISTGVLQGRRKLPYLDEKYGICDVVYRVERRRVIIEIIRPAS